MNHTIDHWKTIVSKPMKEVLSRERLEAFKNATHFEGPVEEIPSTYFTRFRQTEFEIFDQMEVELSQVLHGEQAYRYHEKPSIDDVIVYQSRVGELKEKRGKSGSMIFVHILTQFKRESDQVCLAESDSTVIIRVKDL